MPSCHAPASTFRDSEAKAFASPDVDAVASLEADALASLEAVLLATALLDAALPPGVAVDVQLLPASARADWRVTCIGATWCSASHCAENSAATSALLFLC